MASFDYTIKDVHGIHARPATELFKLSKQFGSAVKANLRMVRKLHSRVLWELWHWALSRVIQ